MGRPAKPIMMLLDRKKHLGKEDIAARVAAEIKIGDSNFICPDYISADPVAYQKWNEILDFLQKFSEMSDIITSTDSDTIAMYCQTFSEERTLIDLRQKAKADKNKIKFTTQLLKTRDMRQKLAQQLYLTPRSKINIPHKKKETEVDPLQAAGFGYV